jgi:hypothetical protein
MFRCRSGLSRTLRFAATFSISTLENRAHVDRILHSTPASVLAASLSGWQPRPVVERYRAPMRVEAAQPPSFAALHDELE